MQFSSSPRSPILALCGLLTLGAAGCSDGDDGAPAPDTVAFEAFVLDLIQNQTADDNAPQSLSGLTFAFDEDPAAFAELFD
jgi:hypothetical protein